MSFIFTFLKFFKFFSFMSNLVAIELTHLHEYNGKGGICQGYAVFRRHSLELGTTSFGFCNNNTSILFYSEQSMKFHEKLVFTADLFQEQKSKNRLKPTGPNQAQLMLKLQSCTWISYSNLFLKPLENVRLLVTYNFIVFNTTRLITNSPYIISSQTVLVNETLKIPIFHPGSK